MFMTTRIIWVLLMLSFTLLGTRSQLLEPEQIQSLMFTEQITGLPRVLIPTSTRYSGNVLAEEKYTLTMEKTSQKMLPGNYSNTTVYVYSGVTASGKIAEFPGPTIIAKKNVPIKVIWVNNLPGKHILPVDYSQPFIDDPIFRNQVPTVPHAHGISTKVSSDGEPGAYWTASGSKSKSYRTEQTCNKNQAIYTYPNEQEPGIFWYHDHTYGITRLNVYAGLAGMYMIQDNPNQQKSLAQKNLQQRFGTNLTTLYLAVADKSFHTNGDLYYPTQSSSSEYTSWVPQFFGNTITVNGKVWPLLNLQKKKYRIVILNACQNRYLNLYFLHLGRKLPFQLIRVQGDYFQTTISTIEYFLSVGGRVQILLDLTQINGEVILKNNAAAPYPMGDAALLVDKYTGTVLKIQTQVGKQNQKSNLLSQVAKTKVLDLISRHPVTLKEPGPYPTYPQGQKRYYVLNQVDGEDGQVVGMFIDGVGMQVGGNCEQSVFELGKVYDIYLINLTPDTHPIHFHLINFQKVMSFPFDVQKYTEDWFAANGGPVPKGGYKKIPTKFDPQPYQKDNVIMPKSYEKVFRDIIDAQPEEVTVIRIKFSHNNGRPFGFPVSGSRFVWHCHMLQHEDNEMMKYFCVK